MDNLLIAFPNKTEKERIQIAKEFYKNFTDTFIETIKLLSITPQELAKRFTSNYELINDLANEGRNVQVHLGHYFNWEYGNVAFSNYIVPPMLGVFMPIETKLFHRIFYTIRSRFGTNLIAATTFRKDFAPFAKKRFVLILIADQNPGGPDKSFWTPFFGKTVPFLKGPEKSAVLTNSVVVMARIIKVKRGYYHGELELLTTTPRELPEGTITKAMVAYIEKALEKQPSNYLWSHRRWKWEYDADKYGDLLI